LKELKKILPGVLIVMLTVFSDDERIFYSILAGADGYILKKDPMGQILESLEELRTNGAPMNAQIAKRVLEIFRGIPIKKATFNLSDREKEILDLLVKGFNYKQIADQIFLSPETVRWHLKNIYEKLQVHSRTEAVVKYMQAEKFNLA
jgi:DNA-binding NarL/FixJ family response regulator